MSLACSNLSNTLYVRIEANLVAFKVYNTDHYFNPVKKMVQKAAESINCVDQKLITAKLQHANS